MPTPAAQTGQLPLDVGAPPIPLRTRLLLHLRLRSELSRFLLSVIYLFAAAITCTVAIQLSDSKWFAYLRDTGRPDPMLNDLILNEVLLGPATIVDGLLMSLLAVTLVMIVVTSWLQARRNPYTTTTVNCLLAYRRLFWITGTLYFARALVLSVTLLPSPVQGCKPVDATGQSAADYLRRGVLIIVGLGATCTDLLFSGHTMLLCTCAIHFRIYCRNRWIAYVAYIWATVGMIMIVLTHFHYTADVVLAIMITLGAYATYFGAITHAIERFRWMLHHRDIETSDASQGYWWGKRDARYQAVAHTPRLFGAGLLRLITWLDGIDLRFPRAYGAEVDSAAALGDGNDEAQKPAADSATLVNFGNAGDGSARVSEQTEERFEEMTMRANSPPSGIVIA